MLNAGKWLILLEDEREKKADDFFWVSIPAFSNLIPNKENKFDILPRFQKNCSKMVTKFYRDHIAFSEESMISFSN